ncbi:uncharacterized protein SRS1_13028 [Sporisorium reilianum f. sp. reilianum]|uniref:Uncharacterized protein n=1 Tax=Sporisorium reilianum f. sp. reilianum TaxID=72559 RepID=A0A2N8UBS8_9BASI|nr:uncharacterized protein SRS1_13028 [Sporisorium reilianum f. sp. reilianum]
MSTLVTETAVRRYQVRFEVPDPNLKAFLGREMRKFGPVDLSQHDKTTIKDDGTVHFFVVIYAIKPDKDAVFQDAIKGSPYFNKMWRLQDDQQPCPQTGNSAIFSPAAGGQLARNPSPNNDLVRSRRADVEYLVRYMVPVRTLVQHFDADDPIECDLCSGHSICEALALDSNMVFYDVEPDDEADFEAAAMANPFLDYMLWLNGPPQQGPETGKPRLQPPGRLRFMCHSKLGEAPSAQLLKKAGQRVNVLGLLVGIEGLNEQGAWKLILSNEPAEADKTKDIRARKPSLVVWTYPVEEEQLKPGEKRYAVGDMLPRYKVGDWFNALDCLVLDPIDDMAQVSVDKRGVVFVFTDDKLGESILIQMRDAEAALEARDAESAH